MRIVVTGGTGFIGREVVARLVETAQPDEAIVVTSRHPGSASDLGGRLELAEAFAGDGLSLARAFTGADVVVHAIQFPNHPVERPTRGWTYEEVDGRGTAIAADAARRAGVRRFVYLSGAGAGQGLGEPWFRAKDRAEAAIRAAGLEHALLRPSWVYGPGDRSLNRFVAFCRYLPLVPVVGDGQTAVWPLHVGDLARAVVECVRRPDAMALALELGGPERLTMDQVLRTLQSVLGTRRPLLHHPAGLMKLLVRPLVLLPRPPLSPGAVDFVTRTVEIDPQPAVAYFGFPFRSLAEGLRSYLP
jgi:uncharacterized protein YbjT (DUF2867 family)